MKNKGFTLVELIVVIAIMGVLLIVAFPSVTKLQQTNKYKKIASFGQSMVASCKLYVDQNQEDLWGSSTATGTKTVQMSTLISANLLKAYTDTKDKCTAGSVAVTRTGSKDKFDYTYSYTVNCTVSSETATCKGDESTSTCTVGSTEVYNSTG